MFTLSRPHAASCSNLSVSVVTCILSENSSVVANPCMWHALYSVCVLHVLKFICIIGLHEYWPLATHY